MKSAVFGIAAAGITSILLSSATPAKAVVNFNLTSGSSTNFSTNTITDPLSGLSLTLNNSNSTGNNSSTLNTTSEGLCAWTIVGSGLGRCGYGNTSSTNGISAFQLTFNKSANITGFDISDFELSNISQGTIGFSLDNTSFTSFDFSGTGANPINFSADANQTVFVRTSAVLVSPSNTGLFRVGSFQVEDVPGPLPLLGAAAAFGWSRKLKKKTAATV